LDIHSDFKAQFETMIDQVREPRRVVEDIKNGISPLTDLNRRLTIPTHP
jgi:hypothetical protein